tara:strand:- start:4469 stop:5044 length:576 start_codon:yes stop_codon:yes gene_type:complete
MSRALDAVVALRILKMLATPIEKSDAFKAGIVDKDAKKLREPSGSNELNMYSMLQKFVFKIQYALNHSPSYQAKRLLSFASAIALMREYEETDTQEDVSTLLELYMNDELTQQKAKLLEYNLISFRDYYTEEVAANAVGHGAVDAIGIGAKGEPGVRTLAKWPFPGMTMPDLFRRKKNLNKKIKENANISK